MENEGIAQRLLCTCPAAVRIRYLKLRKLTPQSEGLKEIGPKKVIEHIKKVDPEPELYQSIRLSHNT